MNRRSILSLIGLSPTLPHVLTAAQPAANSVPFSPDWSSGQVFGPPTPTEIFTHDTFKTLFKKILSTPADIEVIESLLYEELRDRPLDWLLNRYPDIAAKKSWSLAAKRQECIHREVKRRVRLMHDQNANSRLREFVRQKMGHNDAAYYIGEL